MIDVAIKSLLREASGTQKVYPSTETVVVVRDLPKVIFSLIDTSRLYTNDGNTGLAKAVYQIDVFASHPSEARALGDAIRIGLDGFKGDQDGTDFRGISFPDGDTLTQGVRAEGADDTVTRFIFNMRVWYREQAGES